MYLPYKMCHESDAVKRAMNHGYHQKPWATQLCKRFTVMCIYYALATYLLRVCYTGATSVLHFRYAATCICYAARRTRAMNLLHECYVHVTYLLRVDYTNVTLTLHICYVFATLLTLQFYYL